MGGRWENGGWVEGVEHRAPLSLNLNLQRKHRERADEDPLQVLREERRCLQNSALLIIIIYFWLKLIAEDAQEAPSCRSSGSLAEICLTDSPLPQGH